MYCHVYFQVILQSPRLLIQHLQVRKRMMKMRRRRGRSTPNTKTRAGRKNKQSQQLTKEHSTCRHDAELQQFFTLILLGKSPELTSYDVMMIWLCVQWKNNLVCSSSSTTLALFGPVAALRLRTVSSFIPVEFTGLNSVKPTHPYKLYSIVLLVVANCTAL